jgi:hypothetical protein
MRQVNVTVTLTTGDDEELDGVARTVFGLFDRAGIKVQAITAAEVGQHG